MAANDVVDLHICIIGAGMGGLATALALAKQDFKHIDVYETASNIGFVGAGIQLAPNMARILDKFGVWTDVEREAVEIKNISIGQGPSDNELARVDLRSLRETYRYPHMVGHRSSLAGSIYAGCMREKAINFVFSTGAGHVNSYGPNPSFVALPRNSDPYEVHCDILLAADGVKSTIRDQILRLQNVDAQIVDTYQAAYRIMLTREQMQDDPELLELIDTECVTRWLGGTRHIVAYPVSSKQIYNISTIQPDTNFAAAPSATYTTHGSKAEMLKVFSDCCPKVRRMLQMVPEGEVCEWKLRVHEPLPSWVLGQTALVGDACHPTLPRLGQGAAQAIEDGAVLGIELSRAPNTSPEALHKSLQVYEKLRKQRADTLVELAATTSRVMHLDEGEAQRERDKQFAALKSGTGPAPDKWVDAEVQKMIYGEDVITTAEEQFGDLYATL